MTQRNATPVGTFFLAAVLAGVIFGLQTQGRLYWLTAPINFFATPLRQPLISLNLYMSRSWSFFKNLPHQERLIKDLRRRGEELALKADRVADLEKENVLLREALKLPTPQPQTWLPVKVISLSRFAVIDHGSLSQIKVGQAVTTGKVYLGQVDSVLQRTARVVLLADNQTKLAARTSSGTVGQVIYTGNMLQLEQVAQKDSLTIEESVFTKGTEQIPDGLLIGTIKQVDNNPATVYKTALIEPASSITDSQVVLVTLD